MAEIIPISQTMHNNFLKTVVAITTIILLLASNFTLSQINNRSTTLVSAEVLLGERLFQETRFAQYFYQATTQGLNINQHLVEGDPQLKDTFRFFGLPPYQIPFIASSFRGQSFSCRSCHMVNEHINQQELGMRSYADFASRSPLPKRSHERPAFTLRNSPVLVDTLVPRSPYLLHYDGEFASMKSLIIATLTGRNLGWKPAEYETAKKHICEVIKKDDGSDTISKKFGAQPYEKILSGTSLVDPNTNKQYQISTRYRLEVNSASCNSILNAIAFFIQRYLQNLQFNSKQNVISPYDTFLQINQLPQKPQNNESEFEYSERLLDLIDTLQKDNDLRFVTKNPHTDDGRFLFHQQPFAFTKTELKGMRIFFNRGSDTSVASGNCVACHPPPHFTDFSLHNIGIAQIEYEAIHGPGTFLKLKIPSISERDENSRLYLPANHKHHDRIGIFRSNPKKSNSLATDLGAWNIFYNTDYAATQEALYSMICNPKAKCENDEQALKYAIALFKTPSLRNLGHSAPYMHNGVIGDLHAVIGFYLSASENSRLNKIRNADIELTKVMISPREIIPLTQFLVSLYEDYQ